MNHENNIHGATNVRNESDAVKVNFIENVLLQTDMPPSFIGLRNANFDKIFFYIENGITQRRNYILFEHNKFYCVYCICYSLLGENILVKGLEYVAGCRISVTLKNHECSKNHQLAERLYLQHSTYTHGGTQIQKNAKRNVIRIIMKIIIFLATHGEFRRKKTCSSSYFARHKHPIILDFD